MPAALSSLSRRPRRSQSRASSDRQVVADVRRTMAQENIHNFMVVGPRRGGLRALQTALDSHAALSCHAELFHPDEAIRRDAHEAYYGPCLNPAKDPTWLTGAQGGARANAWRYVDQTVFDRPRRDETAVGTCLTYDDVERWDLLDLIEERALCCGRFTLFHVHRHPLACLISLRQAEKSGRWACDAMSPPAPFLRLPLRLDLDADVVDAFRRHRAFESKLDRAAKGATVRVEYREIRDDFQGVVSQVVECLGERPDPGAVAASRRIDAAEVPKRILNMPELLVTASSEIRNILLEGDLA